MSPNLAKQHIQKMASSFHLYSLLFSSSHSSSLHQSLSSSASLLLLIPALGLPSGFLGQAIHPSKASISHTFLPGGRNLQTLRSYLTIKLSASLRIQGAVYCRVQPITLWYFLDSVTTGSKFSSHGPIKVKTAGEHNVHQKLVHYLTNFVYVRNLVSKKRRRMLVAGYDLDMSYITDRLLAMSYPAEHMRAMYRNPLWQVKDVLDMRHSGHYKVYNLCAEESYDPSHFHGRVEAYPFDDNHVPPLQMIKLLCESIYLWLSSYPQNVAVIHCMAGKGRTGLMVCAYLVYSGMSAEAALQMYANRRTTDNRGVSIPSQRRYVGYWSKLLTYPRGSHIGPPVVELPQPCNRELRRIRLYDAVNTKSVYFVFAELQEVPGQIYRPSIEVARSCCRKVEQGYHRTNSPRYYLSFVDIDCDGSENGGEEPRFVVQMDTERSAKTCLDHYFEKPLQVAGDLRIIFYEKMFGGRLFYVCFNTAFIKGSLLQFSARDLDKLGGKGKSICGPSFCLELFFAPSNHIQH